MKLKFFFSWESIENVRFDGRLPFGTLNPHQYVRSTCHKYTSPKHVIRNFVNWFVICFLFRVNTSLMRINWNASRNHMVNDNRFPVGEKYQKCGWWNEETLFGWRLTSNEKVFYLASTNLCIALYVALCVACVSLTYRACVPRTAWQTDFNQFSRIHFLLRQPRLLINAVHTN